MSSDVKEINNTLILHSASYVNKEASEKTADIIYDAIGKGKKLFLINMEKTTVINSVGVSIFIEIIEKLQENDGRIGFYNLAPIVSKTFKIMGITDYATIYTSETQALEGILSEY